MCRYSLPATGIILILFLFVTDTVVAQQPSWIDYYKRSQMYPDDIWITGFVSGYNTANEDPGKLVDTYETMARDKVIQSIEIEIETQNEMTISNINGQSDEAFLSKSVSFAHAKINGLKTEHFYDKKKNEVYAFSYVNRKELAFYYKNLLSANQSKLEQKLKEGRSFLKSGNKEEALRSFYEGMPLLAEIDQAHMLLVALNRKMLADIHLDEIDKLSIELNSEISQLQKGTKLNMQEAAYFVAYGLFIQFGNKSATLQLSPTTYLNTGFESQFSHQWETALKEALVKAGAYQVKVNNPTMPARLLVTGNYWLQDNHVVIQARILQQGQIVAAASGRIPTAYLTSQDIIYWPDELSRIAGLNNFSLRAQNPEVTVKAGIATEKPLLVSVSFNANNQTAPSPNTPLVFVDKSSKKVLCSATTNAEGMASGYLPPMDFNQAFVQVEATIDLAKYIPIDTLSSYFELVKKQIDLLPAQFTVKVEKQVYCIQSEELLLGSPMEVLTIEPVIKQALVDKGFVFTDEPQQADYLIHIEASSSTGTSYQGVYFTFVDVNLSVTKTSDDKEIFKTHLDQIKGGGANYSKAGKKAYATAAEELKKRMEAFK